MCIWLEGSYLISINTLLMRNTTEERAAPSTSLDKQKYEKKPLLSSCRSHLAVLISPLSACRSQLAGSPLAALILPALLSPLSSHHSQLAALILPARLSPLSSRHSHLANTRLAILITSLHICFANTLFFCCRALRIVNLFSPHQLPPDGII